MSGVFKKKSEILNQCHRYNISIWEHPQFLFVVMGMIIIISIIATYLVGIKYFIDPEAIIGLVFLITIVLFSISFVISRSFEKLAEANRVKSEIIGIVSHQLRSPLTNLKWIHDFLIYDKGNLTKDQLENLSMMEESINRMIGVTANLLAVSKIELKKISIHKENVSLETLVYQIIKEKTHNIKESKYIEFSFSIDEKLPLVFTDLSQIRWIIESLVDNAIRYTIYNDGEKEILVEIKKKGENEIFFEIKDNGAGIPKKDQKFIFEKFFHGKNAFKYNTQGTGLGLFICASIIDELGGKIGFKSQEKVGSSFWFILPIK